MKSLLIAFALLAGLTVHAQSPADSFDHAALIRPYRLDITWNKTTLLIFPSAIQSADRGGQYVLAEKVKGADNVLKVKAGQKGFEESNLQVITTDGKVYPFTVSYSDSPAYQTIDLGRQTPYAPVRISGVSLNSKQLADLAAKVAGSAPFLKGARYRKHGISLKLDGIYVDNDVLFMRYHLHNNTAIRYDEGSLRFYIRDTKKVKRTAEQDKEILPLYVLHSGTPELDKGEVIVAAFQKFTIAENKKFITEMNEQSGDRNPDCHIDQDKLLKAKALR